MTSILARGRTRIAAFLLLAVPAVLAAGTLVVPPAFAGTVSLDPTSYNFGNQRVGLAAQANLVLTNTGTSTQVAGSIITGATTSFAAAGCGSDGPIVLEPGGACVITVTFQPSSIGVKTATLTVQQDGGASATAALAGTGVEATAVLSDSALDFGGVELGASSPPQTVTVSNDGSADLTVGAVEISGDNGDFSTDGGCDGDVVPVGGTCQVEVTFTPAALGLRAATLTIQTEVGDRTVDLDGSGADTTDPTVVLSAPTAPFTLASSTVLQFTGQDAQPGSGVVSFRAEKRSAPWNGAFGPWEQPAAWAEIIAESLSAGLAAGRTTCFGVSSRDAAGNLSPRSPARCTARPLGDRSLAASSAWVRSTGSSYYQGTVTRTSTKGAVLTRASVRASRLALVVTKCPTCGSVGVYLGSTLIGKVSLTRSTKASRVLVVLPAFSLRSGTVTIKVLTSGRPVLIEGLGVFRAS